MADWPDGLVAGKGAPEAIPEQMRHSCKQSGAQLHSAKGVVGMTRSLCVKK